MRKYVAAVYALVLMCFVAGCGGGSSSSSPTLTATVSLKASDFYGKTFYVTPVDATSLGGYLALKFSPPGNTVEWSSTPVTAGEPVLDTIGTWNEATIATDKILILASSSGIRKFSLIQKEASYWLFYDGGTFKTSRLYFEIPSLPSGSALGLIQDYQKFIKTTVDPSTTPNAVKLGGSIQAPPTAPLATVFSDVSTVAGIEDVPGYANGIGTSASFYQPTGIATDGTYLYVADYNNHIIRKIDMATKVVTRLAGIPGVAGITNSYDGTGDTATFNFPSAVAVYGTYLYVADTGNNVIRRVDTSSGVVTLVAGSTSAISGAVDSLNGTDARFNLPTGITTDGTNLFVADFNNQMIRKIVISSGAVVTIAGAEKSIGSTDSTDGTGATARFYSPARIATDGTNLYVTDSVNRTIRKIVIVTGNVTTLAGIAGTIGYSDTAPGVAATFKQPNGITTDGTYLYVTDSFYNTIRRIVIATGAVTTIAGSATAPPGSVNGPVASASFDTPIGITTDGLSLYVTDSNNHTIRKIK